MEAALAQHNFAWQALALRLAVIKSHSRTEVNNRALRLQTAGTEAHLGYSPHWGEQNPRTLYLLAEEVATWERSGPLRLLLQSSEPRTT